MTTRRFIGIGLASMLAAVGVALPASAHDDACPASVWAMPVEQLPLVEDWEWASFAPIFIGGVGASLEGPEDDEGDRPSLSVSIVCMTGAAEYLAAEERAADFIGERRTVSVVPLGDEVRAFRTEFDSDYLTDTTTILWRRGEILSQLTVEDGIDWGDAQDFAAAIDAILPT
jgi:hypothetical protein